MAESFYTLITKIGQAQIANATALGSKITFKTLKVGDGNGAYYDPTENQTDLVHTVWSGNINSVDVDPNNSNWIVVQAIIPSSDGDFTVREMGIYDDNNNLLAISKVAETYKPVISDGSTKELLMKMVLAVSNASTINLKIDPTLVFATKNDLNSFETIVNNQLTDLKFQKVGGTATAITLTTKEPLVDGLGLTFIATNNNGGIATTINGKNLYKPNTTTSPNIIKGKAYTIWYDLTGDCFFIKASAEGTATKDCVLAGYTFSNDNDTNIGGTIVSNGALNYSLPINGTFNIPSGYTTGGKVTQNIPVKTAQTFVPSTTDQIITLGQYLSGNQVIKGDANFKSDNIPNGLTIFGITGTYIDYNTNPFYYLKQSECFVAKENVNKTLNGCVHVYNDKLYIIGIDTSNVTTGSYVYDIKSNVLTPIARKPNQYANFSSVLYNNKIYCIGGQSITALDIYDIPSNSWSSGTNLPNARYYSTAHLYNGKIYTIGGVWWDQASSQFSTTNTNNIIVYDISSNTWNVAKDSINVDTLASNTGGGYANNRISTIHSSVIKDNFIYIASSSNGYSNSIRYNILDNTTVSDSHSPALSPSLEGSSGNEDNTVYTQPIFIGNAIYRFRWYWNRHNYGNYYSSAMEKYELNSSNIYTRTSETLLSNDYNYQPNNIVQYKDYIIITGGGGTNYIVVYKI